jgi:hypothetical protein
MADIQLCMNHAERIDIFPDHSVLTFRFEAKRIRDQGTLVLPDDTLLKSVTVYDDQDRNILYILTPSNRDRLLKSGHQVKVSKDENIVEGQLIDTHKSRVSILTDSDLITIYNPDRINTITKVNGSILLFIGIEKEAKDVFIQLRMRTMSLMVYYSVDVEDTKMRIRPKYRVSNTELVDRSYNKISLYSGTSNGLNTGRKLLNIQGDITSDGLLIDMLEPIDAEYQIRYEWNVNKSTCKLIYDFIPNEDLLSGSAEFYRKHHYSGSYDLPEVQKHQIGRLDTGYSDLDMKSHVTMQCDDSGTIINIAVNVLNTSDKIMVSVIYKSDCEVESYGKSKPGTLRNRKAIWRVGFGPSDKRQSVTLQLRTMN